MEKLEKKKSIIITRRPEEKMLYKSQKMFSKNTEEVIEKDNMSFHQSFINFDPKNLKDNAMKNKKHNENELRFSGKINENVLKSGNMKEIIEILQNISDKDSNNIFPNIFILGNKKIGKTSFIETLTGYNLFLPEIINVPIKLTISNNYKNESLEKSSIENLVSKYIETIKSEDKNLDEKTHNKDIESDILIYCDHSVFRNLNEFHERLKERSNDEIVNKKFLEIKLFLLEKYHPIFPFDLSIFETPNEYLENLNLIGEKNSLFSARNSIFLVMLSFDQLDKLRYFKDLLSKYDSNLENTIFILNKSDMIENRNDALSAIDKLKDYNYCFIRNRKLEERKTIDIQDFYEEEKKFFEASKIFCNLESVKGIYSVFDMINNIFINKIFNQVNVDEFNQKRQQNESILKSLNEPIPNDEKSKRNYITNLLKKTIGSVKENFVFYKNCFSHFFDYCYKIKKEVKNNSQFDNINRYIASNIFKELKSFEQNYLKMIDLSSTKARSILLEVNNEKITKQEIENHIFKNVKIIFGKLCDEIASVFKKFEENLYIEISMIINKIFSHIDNNFVILIRELFYSTLFVELENFVSFCNLYKEMETTVFYVKNIQILQKINILYDFMAKSDFSVTYESAIKLEEILRDILSSNLLSFLENYSKSFSCFFLDKCIGKIENIALIDINLDQFREVF